MRSSICREIDCERNTFELIVSEDSVFLFCCISDIIKNRFCDVHLQR